MDDTPPYRRIAAEIRGRIERGELPPGRRVPSTRRITQQWGVAMATASKALAELRDAGLVESRPGSGTVVSADHGTRPRQQAPGLNTERIVRSAIVLADAEGMDAVSMRRISATLGVSTMALYRHVRGSEELQLLMLDAVCAESPLPTQIPAGWRATMEFAARHIWAVFREHPWAAQALSMTRPQIVPNLINYLEWMLGPLRDMGLDHNTTVYLYLTIMGYVRGTGINLQAEALATQETGMNADEWVDTQGDELGKLLATGRYPNFAFVVGQEFDYDLDNIFEFGLTRLLDGFSTVIEHD